MEGDAQVLLLALDQLKQENANLKTGLSKVLQSRVNGRVIEKAEEFQQMFINKDLVIDLCRHDVIASTIGPGTDNGQEPEKMVQLQHEVEQLIDCFLEMKAAFERYVTEM